MTKRLSICVNSSPVSAGKKMCCSSFTSEKPEEEAEAVPVQQQVLSQITPFLLIGDDRVTEEELTSRGVTAIIDCRTLIEQEVRGLVGENLQLDRLSLPIRDNKSEDVSKFFYVAVHFIERQKSLGGRVFVHCTRGISRSSAVCCAYLIWANRMDCREALRLLKSRHSIADPNPSFAMQLADFAQTRSRDIIAFQVSMNGRALIGPLSRGEAEAILRSSDGYLLVVSRVEDRQFVWCADGQSSSVAVAKRGAQVLSALKCAPREVVDVSSHRPGNSNDPDCCEPFRKAIESLN